MYHLFHLAVAGDTLLLLAALKLAGGMTDSLISLRGRPFLSSSPLLHCLSSRVAGAVTAHCCGVGFAREPWWLDLLPLLQSVAARYPSVAAAAVGGVQTRRHVCAHRHAPLAAQSHVLKRTSHVSPFCSGAARSHHIWLFDWQGEFNVLQPIFGQIVTFLVLSAHVCTSCGCTTARNTPK